MNRTIYSFDIFEDMLKMDFYQIHKHDRDNVIVLVGYEGDGKSNLGLHAVEIWLKKIMKYKDWETRLKTALGVRPTEWSGLMQEIAAKNIHGSINDFDEAGDVISGKHSVTRFITAIEDTWKVIRGLNMETIITSPSLFILSPYIRNHRVRTCWFVEKRGVCHVFYGDRLQDLIALNENKEKKNMLIVDPNFSFHFPKYKGTFLKEYLDMKNDKMYSVLTKLNSEAIDYESK